MVFSSFDAAGHQDCELTRGNLPGNNCNTLFQVRVTAAWLGVRNKTQLEFSRGPDTWRVSPFSRVECADYSVLREAALAGLGIGFLPSYATYDDFARRRLRSLLTEYEALPSLGNRLYAVTPQSRYMASQVRCFLEFLMNRLKDDPAWHAEWPSLEVVHQAGKRRALRGSGV